MIYQKTKKLLFGYLYFWNWRKCCDRYLEKAKVNPDKKVADLTEEEIAKIRSVMTADFKVEGALRSEVQQNIKRLMDIGTYGA